ncbi:hypothetical protein A11A3_08175 [Alcanivorax hongdengensis A-11-3]|uniref:DUF481 domain-containing protein n=1 Tax=Alcanivorax hongdengensis A-11-3 TaxID=1177179 RepID=L0WCW7_9GAMM|nr:DUF481 domain-containing protein [Alcanivorax hongdengensis]EKF74588.1 hypothetical protein A11A3_08175 [Alcanivorax hongdengensis A-11-3]
MSSSARVAMTVFMAGVTLTGISSKVWADTTYTPPSQDPRVWRPPSFDPQRWDWIQLDTGEWVKGHLKAMQEESVEIDSDHFDVISIDWEDVAFIRTGRTMSVLLDDGSTVLGSLDTEAGKLVIGGGEPVDFERVLGIASASAREFDLWSGDVAVGANFRSGNVDQKEFNATVMLKRRTAANSTRIGYTGNYAQNDGVENANNHRATLSHDYRVSRKWLFRPIQAEFNRDPFQNLDQQWLLGFGAVYSVFDTSKLDWVISAGPGYQRTQFVEVQAGQDRTVSTPAFLVGSTYSQDLTAAVDLDVTYQLVLTNEESGRASHDLYAALDVDLTKRLDFRVATTWSRIENPQPDADGVTPEKDDLRLTVGLSWDI